MFTDVVNTGWIVDTDRIPLLVASHFDVCKRNIDPMHKIEEEKVWRIIQLA